MSLGGLRVGETVYPIRRVALRGGEFVVDADLPGPVTVTAGTPVMVYGQDGTLIVRGCWRVDVDVADGDVAAVSYGFSPQGKVTTAAAAADEAAARRRRSR